jgi:hypothetical protein
LRRHYTIAAKNRYGCATRRIKGTCDNTATILRQRIEARVLAGLKDRLLMPELVAEFVRSFAEKIVASRRDMAQKRSAVERQLAETDRSLSSVIRAIEQGAWSETLRTRLAELEARKAVLRSELQTMGAPARSSHPSAAKLYRAKVAKLESVLNDPAIKAEASDALHGLIERVVLTPDADAPDGLRTELFGDLAQIQILGLGGRRR